jgi:hypothetical protein
MRGIFLLNLLEDVFVPNGLDLVLWKPAVHSVMLKVHADHLHSREQAGNIQYPIIADIEGYQSGPNASLGRVLSFEFVSSQGKHNNNQNIIQSATIQPTSNTAPASTGLEIVPWKPILDVIALQLWPLIVESRHQARIAELTAPVIVLGDVECQQSPTTSGLEDFEFQMG